MFRFRISSLLLLFVLVFILIVVGCVTFPPTAAPTAPTLSANLSTFGNSTASRTDLIAMTTAQTAANTAARPASSILPVVGWYGQLLADPLATPNGDYRFQLAGDGPTLMLTGANSVLDYRLSTMPDTDPNVHIWGVLLCDTAGFEDCQVRVSRLRRDTGDQVVTVDTVDGWEGALEAVWNEAGEVIGDQFVLAGDYPAQYGAHIGVQYGVEAAFGDTTGQDLTARIAGLRDSGRLVRVWGALTCGVSDVNGCRIAVSNIISLPRAAVPERITHEVVDGLSGTIVMNDVNAPYPVGFRFETSDHIVGVVSSDEFVQAQLKELMSASKDNFPTTVRIWGMIYYHDTNNLADDLITITALEGPTDG